MLIPVVMSGGSGTRLWPLSRALYPKQFLPLAGEHTMLQATVERLKGLEHLPPLFVCNEEHRFIVAEQLRLMGARHGGIVLEPMGRNTAPAIALAALQALAANPDSDPLLLVLAADHVIHDPQSFRNAVVTATLAAQSGKLVTFGIVPTSAHTGYGYIKAGDSNDSPWQTVEAFVEKPTAALATTYLEQGGYYWNSGMFLFSAKNFLSELAQFRPDILAACQDAFEARSSDLEFVRVDRDRFAGCPEDSIDYAVMEKTSNAVVLPLAAGWSDVGSWSSLWDVLPRDEAGNTCHGDVMAEDSRNCLIRADERLIAAIGLDDIVIVDTKDALLVAHKDKAQNVKKIVDNLKREGRSEYVHQREVYRPWGKYDSIDNGQRYQVKRITVKPGAKLSVQMHHHRAEHWIVVSGTAKVTNGDSTFLVTENNSTYIPVGVVHALENPGKIPLELIEVQSGAYLGEDDIVRFEDRYGRN
ncbi:MAG: mannose-1-phosphate guanylyltransferase/mannose-6-phosphate isomerase [Gammaproteobacteria bacterium]|nr:mannose-1-phosphate guanylyltransferase/mannose-6-phosphate isomerase [Gammaproteobacteria bacterium]